MEELYDEIIAKGIDEIYCMCVNDAFVMDAWGKELGIEKVKLIPDGDGKFTEGMDMLVHKPAQGFGYRSWRYAMTVNDGEVDKMWVEGKLLPIEMTVKVKFDPNTQKLEVIT